MRSHCLQMVVKLKSHLKNNLMFYIIEKSTKYFPKIIAKNMGSTLA